MNNQHFLVYYCWFSILITYSTSKPNEIDPFTEPLLDDRSSSPDTPRPPLSAILNTQLSFAWNRLVTFTFQARILSESYCKDVYTEADVETLLNLAQELHVDPWWREREGWLYHREIPKVLCSAVPNAGVPIAFKISDDEFFRSRNINIPIRLGRKGVRLNKYQHLNKEPIWKTMLECDCEILRDVVDNDNVCVNGKNVNLSRGVGGDTSFFIHAPDSSGTYKVMAHICFST